MKTLVFLRVVPIATVAILAGCTTGYSSYSYNSTQNYRPVPSVSRSAYPQSATIVEEHTPPAYVPTKRGPGSKYKAELYMHNQRKAEAAKRDREIAQHHREQQIAKFLDSDALMGSKVQAIRKRLKSAIVQHDRELARLDEAYSRANRSPQRDPQYNRLVSSRASLKNSLDDLDARIESAMLKRATGNAADSLIWSTDDMQAVDSLYVNCY